MDTLLEVASNLKIESQKSQMTFLLKHLYDFFISKDCELMELNPIVLGVDEQLYVNSAKIKIDANAHFRQL